MYLVCRAATHLWCSAASLQTAAPARHCSAKRSRLRDAFGSRRAGVGTVEKRWPPPDNTHWRAVGHPNLRIVPHRAEIEHRVRLKIDRCDDPGINALLLPCSNSNTEDPWVQPVVVRRDRSGHVDGPEALDSATGGPAWLSSVASGIEYRPRRGAPTHRGCPARAA